jgi:hypothetical protein
MQGDGFGSAVSSAGDVNGDGFSDILIGSPTANRGGREFTGLFSLFVGSPAGIERPERQAIIGDSTRGFLGSSFAGACDLNLDGYSDVVIGASGSVIGLTFGFAYTFVGLSTGISIDASQSIRGEIAGDNFARSLHCVGDTDGDGFNDLLAGAPESPILLPEAEGTVLKFAGSPMGFRSPASSRIIGVSSRSAFGHSVAFAGDVNADGFSDIIVGATGADPSGRTDAGTATIFLGSSSGIVAMPARVLEGQTAHAQFGFSVSSPGDVNGDGFSDVLVGAFAASPGGRSGAGSVSLFLGSSTGIPAAPSRVLEGPAAGDQLGFSVVR